MENKPKRILYIMHDLSRGGIQSFIYHLIKSLPSKDYIPIIFYYSDNTHMKNEFEELGVDIHFMSNTGISKKYKPFKKIIKSINPDIIHFQGHEGMFIMFLWLKLMGYGNKVINTFHSTHFDELNGINRFKEFLVQFCIYKFIHVAKDTEMKYSKFYVTRPKKHSTIYNGIDINEFQNKLANTAPHPLMNPNNINIIGVATFNPQKGYQTSIPALQKIIENNQKIVYHIVGGAYEHQETFSWAKQYIKDNNLNEKIILHGVQKNILPFLRGADIFLSPSEKELMPVSFLEALAAGLPIIGTSVGGVPEILGENGEWGILVNPKNESELINAINKMIESKEIRLEYHLKSLQRAKYFDIQRIMKLYIKQYEEIK